MNWKNSHVLVTGGASFIGSAIVDSLVERGARIRVVDNLSSGKLENIQQHMNWVRSNSSKPIFLSKKRRGMP